MSPLVTYLIGCIGLIIKPGPDLLCTISTALSHGRARACCLMAGLVAGCWIWILLLALGAAAVLVYELLRTVRLNRRRRWVTHLTDGVYVLAAFWALLRFTLSIGQGELRLYVLPCAALGALLSRQLLAPFFRGVWQFWWGAAAQTGRWLCRPVILFLHFCKKVLVLAQKNIAFLKKIGKIKLYRKKNAAKEAKDA